VPTLVLELLHGPDQADVALLDQVLEGNSHVAEVLCDRDHELQVVLHEAVLEDRQPLPGFLHGRGTGQVVLLGHPHLLLQGEQGGLELAQPDLPPLEPAGRARRALASHEGTTPAGRPLERGAMLEDLTSDAPQDLHGQICVAQQSRHAIVQALDRLRVRHRHVDQSTAPLELGFHLLQAVVDPGTEILTIG
jgi:hypothetical protein